MSLKVHKEPPEGTEGLTSRKTTLLLGASAVVTEFLPSHLSPIGRGERSQNTEISIIATQYHLKASDQEINQQENLR